MRARSLLIVLAALGTTVSVVAPTPTVLAAPAGCDATPAGLVIRCQHDFPTARVRGSIGLIGDSVLLGSSPGVSTPSLPTLLAGKGWGPIRMTTALGMRTYYRNGTTSSAYHVLGGWKAAGFEPSVLAVNIGANHLGDCTPATVATCRANIDQLLTRIDALWPGATVWWSKIVQRAYPSGAYTPQMLGWNAALDQAAKARPGRLVVWDWPSALNTSGIVTDIGSIHPVSGAEYVKRSTLIANHLTATMRSTFVGPRATAAAAIGSGLAFAPHPNARMLYDGPLTAGTTKQIGLAAVLPPGAGAVAVGITSSRPAGAGYVTLFPCGEPLPKVSSLNFTAGQARSAQAIVRLGAGGTLCARASVGVTVRIALQGTFVSDVVPTTAQTLHLLAPKRLVNTTAANTTTNRTIPVVETSLPGADIGAVALNVTIDKPTASGNVTVYRCDAAAVPPAATVSFTRGETVAGAVFAPVSATDEVCVRVRIAAGSTFRLVVDRTGVFTRGDGGSRFVPVRAKRMLDTRGATYRVGGWFGRHQTQQTIDVNAAAAGTVGVSGTVTMVNPATTGYVTAFGCGTPPPTSTTNGRPGAAAASTATSVVDPQGRLCLYTSTNTDTLFDVSGWWQTPVGP